MLQSGITRRIDELGRIVIPKEIRYNLGIREGEPLEILVDDNSIIIKKYSQIENIKSISNNICEIISDVFNVNIIVTDREKVIAASKELANIISNPLGEKHKILIDKREDYNSENIEIMFDIEGYFYIIPIITNSDCSGLVLIVAKYKSEENIKYAKIVQKLIVYKLDVA